MLEDVVLMPQEVRTQNISGALAFVEHDKGSVKVNEVIDSIDFDSLRIADKHDPTNYISFRPEHLHDNDYWISNGVSIEILSKIAEVLGGPQRLFEAGRWTVHNHMHIAKRAKWLKFIPADEFQKIGARINKQYNRTKTITVQPNQGGAFLEATYRPNISTYRGKHITKEICYWNRGIYWAQLELTGVKKISIEETQCVADGAPYCRFEGAWKTPLWKKSIDPITKKLSPTIERVLDIIDERDEIQFNLLDQVSTRTAQIEKLSAEKEELNQKLNMSNLLNSERNYSSWYLHSLRNLNEPIHSLISMCEKFIDMSPAKQQQILPYLKKQTGLARFAYNESSRLINNINQVYNPMEEGEIDINESIRAVSKLVIYGKYAAYIDINCDFQDIPTPEHYDPNAINTQVYLNILRNARDAIDDRRRMDQEFKGKILVSTKNQPHYIDIEFADNGVPVQSHLVPQLFEKQFTTKEKGSGLGLHNARFILESSGIGSIRYERATGEYTKTFVVRLNK